jgi:hypothetical protein
MEKMAYFYCNRAEENRRDPKSIINTLVQQLAQIDDHSLGASCRHLHRPRTKSAKVFEAHPSRDSRADHQITDIYSQTTICVDALDEVDRDIRI